MTATTTRRSYEALAIDTIDRIATVTLNRPDKLNAADAALHTELSWVFRDLSDDPDVDVIIVTGAGRAFCAGGDIDWMQSAIDHPQSFETTSREAKEIVFSILDCEKPIIAKVNGVAIGLGATLALFCDIIYMAETAKIGDPHVSIGLVAGDGSAVIWPQLIGYARAKEFLMTGDLMTASDAERIGLVNHVVDPEQLDAEVDKMARRLTGSALKAVKWTKVTVNIGLKQLAHSIMDASMAHESLSNLTADHAEAVDAFRNKRTPEFLGR
jgi:enoyl-CoA hydratase